MRREPVPGEAEAVAGLMSLARQQARRFARKAGGMRCEDDAYSDCLLAALRCVRREAGAPSDAMAHAAAAMRHGCIDGLRAATAKDAAVREARGRPQCLRGCVPSVAGGQGAAEARDAVEVLLHSLRPPQRRAAELYYLGGLSVRQVARRMGRPLRQAWELIDQARAQMRAMRDRVLGKEVA